jgi:hypothetical protein
MYKNSLKNIEFHILINYQVLVYSMKYDYYFYHKISLLYIIFYNKFFNKIS